MYGQIHCIVRELIQVKFGMTKWYEVLDASGLTESTHFQVFSVYEDPMTLKLLDAVATVLGSTIETVLKEFGVYFVTYCLKHGYDKMMLTLGQDMFSFINNLDSLHSMLSLSYRGIVAPSFRCEENDNGTLTIHYYSWRKGLYPIVPGLVEAVSKELFNQIAKLTVITQEEIEVVPEKIQYHTAIKCLGTHQIELQNRSRGCGMVTGKAYDPIKPRIKRKMDSSEQAYIGMGGTPSILTVEDMCMAFPYHMLLDESLKVKQCGESVQELVPIPINEYTHLSDFAVITLPIMSPTSENIHHFINSLFFISVRTGSENQPFVLKGQFLWLPDGMHFLFMGSPHLLSWKDFNEMNVTMSDIPLYDGTRELVLLNQQRIAEIDVAKKLDETTRELKMISQALEVEKHKTEELLHEMMPRKVAMQLTLYGRVKAGLQPINEDNQKYDSCTVLFSDIVTFTNITGMCQADQVVNMLNDMYHRFDIHCDTHNVYKVETIGDAYMAVTGVPEVQDDHAERMADFAMDMLEEGSHVLSPATGLPLQIRVGLHSGSVVAGVIGKKKPRFDLYGGTVNMASRMESNGVPGRIQVSNTTFEKLYPQGYVFKTRGEMEMKGKGKVVTYFLVGTLDRDLEQPDDEFTSLSEVFDPEAEANPFRKKLVKRTLPPKPPTAISFVDSKAKQAPKENKPTTLSWNLASKAPPVKKEAGENAMLSPISGVPEHHTHTWDLSPPPPSASRMTDHRIPLKKPSRKPTAFPRHFDKKQSHAFLPQIKMFEQHKHTLPEGIGLAASEPKDTVSSVQLHPTASRTKENARDEELQPVGPEKHPVLKRIEPSPFLKPKSRAQKPEVFRRTCEPQEENLLPFGNLESSETASSFFEKHFSRKGCILS